MLLLVVKYQLEQAINQPKIVKKPDKSAKKSGFLLPLWISSIDRSAIPTETKGEAKNCSLYLVA